MPSSDTMFKPGNSGGGRPRMPEELRKAFQDAAPHALATLMSIVQGGNNAKPSDQVKAAEVLLDRGYGKPVQAIEAEVSDLRPINFAPVLGKLVEKSE